MAWVAGVGETLARRGLLARPDEPLVRELPRRGPHLALLLRAHAGAEHALGRRAGPEEASRRRPQEARRAGFSDQNTLK